MMKTMMSSEESATMTAIMGVSSGGTSGDGSDGVMLSSVELSGVAMSSEMSPLVVFASVIGDTGVLVLLTTLMVVGAAVALSNSV